MKIFRIKADADFIASDIDDALLKLSEYFLYLNQDPMEAGLLFCRGKLEVEEIKNKIKWERS